MKHKKLLNLAKSTAYSLTHVNQTSTVANNKKDNTGQTPNTES